MCTLWLLWKTQQIHGTRCFTNNDKKLNIPAEPNFQILHICKDVCDMSLTVGWPNLEQIFHKMIIALNELQLTKS